MKEKEVNPAVSRIRIESKALEWMKGKSKRIVTYKICQQCPGTAPCMKACPVDGAISRDSKWGTVLIDDSKCTACQECVKACPFKAVWYDKRMDRIIKCDICDGKPQCVKWCPTKAIKLVNLE
jgi:Fe-S-cluster-containing hydrogenase component 2